jgi:hypothetical protein
VTARIRKKSTHSKAHAKSEAPFRVASFEFPSAKAARNSRLVSKLGQRSSRFRSYFLLLLGASSPPFDALRRSLEIISTLGAALPRVRILSLFVGLAEIVSENSFFDVLESPEILNDISAGVVEENIAVSIAANGHEPF